jgi:hypothetical protein
MNMPDHCLKPTTVRCHFLTAGHNTAGRHLSMLRYYSALRIPSLSGVSDILPLTPFLCLLMTPFQTNSPLNPTKSHYVSLVETSQKTRGNTERIKVMINISNCIITTLAIHSFSHMHPPNPIRVIQMPYPTQLPILNPNPSQKKP